MSILENNMLTDVAHSNSFDLVNGTKHKHRMHPMNTESKNIFALVDNFRGDLFGRYDSMAKAMAASKGAGLRLVIIECEESESDRAIEYMAKHESGPHITALYAPRR